MLSIGPTTYQSSGRCSVESWLVYLTFKNSPERNSPGLVIVPQWVLFQGSHLLQILLKPLHWPTSCQLAFFLLCIVHLPGMLFTLIPFGKQHNTFSILLYRTSQLRKLISSTHYSPYLYNVGLKYSKTHRKQIQNQLKILG